MQGKLVVLDGADGAGKATQAKLLVARLRLEGYRTETLDFPRYSQSIFGELIGECLDGGHGDFMNTDAKIVSALYALDRYHEKNTLLHWLSEGKLVILDRYVSANMLHQGAKLGSDDERREIFEWLRQVEYGLLGLPEPDIVFYLNTPFEYRIQMLEKAAGEGKNGGKIDVAENDILHQKAVTSCAKLLLAHEKNWKEVLCVASGNLRIPASIHDEIFFHTSELLE